MLPRFRIKVKIPIIERSPSHIFFIRPRRFGKSLWLSVLDSIISVGNKDFSSIRTQDDYRQIKKQEEQKERYRNYLKNGLNIPKELLNTYALKEIEFNDQDK
jgi:hypothetical protein